MANRLRFHPRHPGARRIYQPGPSWRVSRFGARIRRMPEWYRRLRRRGMEVREFTGENPPQ